MIIKDAMVCSSCNTLYHYSNESCPSCKNKSAVALKILIESKNNHSPLESLIKVAVDCYNEWKDTKIETKRLPHYRNRREETWAAIKKIVEEYEKLKS